VFGVSTKAVALDPLREVGLNQLTIQATLAGGLDAQALGVLAADLALGGTLVVLTPWLAPVVVIAVSALVAIATVVIVSREYGTTLRSLLADAEALNRKYTDPMSATNPPADAQHAATASTEAPELPPRERLLMPSGPAFPEFVYRFLDKLFHLNMSR
jgi:hypothetical protein